MGQETYKRSNDEEDADLGFFKIMYIRETEVERSVRVSKGEEEKAKRYR